MSLKRPFDSAIRKVLRAHFKKPESRLPLIQFAGVQADAVKRWVNEGILPQGTVLNRLIFFLEVSGKGRFWQVGEPLASLARMVAAGVLDHKAVATELGYPQPHRLFSVIQSERGITGNREKAIGVTVERTRAEFEAALTVLPFAVPGWEKMPFAAPSIVEENIRYPEPKEETSVPVVLQGMPEMHLMSFTAVGLVKTLLPILKSAIVTWSPDHRVAFRRQFGSKHELHELSDVVNALLSEEALRRYQEVQRKISR